MAHLAPFQNYLSALVHSSARDDAAEAARHRAYIAPRLCFALCGLAALPVHLARGWENGTADVALLFAIVVPLSLACYVSGTGRIERASPIAVCAMVTAALVLGLSAGGLSAASAAWLTVVPLEAAHSRSRRTASMAIALALAGALSLVLMRSAGLLLNAHDGTALELATVLPLIYAGVLVLSLQRWLQSQARHLNQEAERARFLAAHAQDIVVRHGRSGAVLSVSRSAQALFQAPPAELLGHRLFDRVHVADRPLYLTAIADAAGNATERTIEFRVRRGEAGAHTEFVWVEMRCRRIDDASAGEKQEGAVLSIIRDISERKEHEAILREARREAERANAAKSRFLAAMSHELRTPLNAIIGFSDMLTKADALAIDADRRAEYAKLIHDSGHHLLSVVNEILDLSKLEAGHFMIAPENFAPASVIRASCDLLALKAHEAGLEIALQLPALPDIVADKRALKQIVLNLVSNAIKFSRPGGRISVGATAGASVISVCVQDTGIGIPAEDLPKIGEPFFQVGDAYDRLGDGSGLGLSIVKGLVELHGGRLEIESRVEEGTRVTVHLPLDCEGKGRETQASISVLSDHVRTAASKAHEPVMEESEHLAQRERKVR